MIFKDVRDLWPVRDLEQVPLICPLSTLIEAKYSEVSGIREIMTILKILLTGYRVVWGLLNGFEHVT